MPEIFILRLNFQLNNFQVCVCRRQRRCTATYIGQSEAKAREPFGEQSLELNLMGSYKLFAIRFYETSWELIVIF